MRPLDHPSPLKGEEAKRAAAWLKELQRRLDELYEQIPEDFSSVGFEYWMEQCLRLGEQIDLLEQALRKETVSPD